MLLFARSMAAGLWLLAVVHPTMAELGEQRVLSTDIDDVTEVHEALDKAEIIPTVIDDFEPIMGLYVSWDSDSADLGNTLKPSALQSAPSVHLEKATPESLLGVIPSASKTFVLILTDPDAPSREDPKWSEFCHWIATGLSIASTSTESLVASLDDVVEYYPPGPPPKTGKHRYVFLAYVPANGTSEKLHLSRPGDRKHWGSDRAGHGVRDWAHDNGLVPIAANFIYAENEEQ